MEKRKPGRPKVEMVETPQESQPPQQDNLITLRKEDLEKMVNEIADKRMGALRQENESLRNSQEIEVGKWMDAPIPKKRVFTANFKLYRDSADEDYGLVIDWWRLRYEMDIDTGKKDKAIYRIVCLYENGERKEIDLQYTEFVQITEQETVEISEWEEKERVLIVDKRGIRRAGVKDGYTMSAGKDLPGIESARYATSDFVPYTVHAVDRIATMKRANGQI